MRTLSIFLTVLATLLAPGVSAAAKSSALGTADQIAVETLALKLINAPEVKKQKEEGRKRLLAQPAAANPEARKTLPRALDDLVYASALAVASFSDPAHPRATWIFTAPHEWFGKKIPGSGIGIENPDNAYRMILVDGVSQYEITLRPHGPLPKMYSLNLYTIVIVDNPDPRHNLDDALAGLREGELKPRADGSFRITVDSDPANGRDNHMQSSAEARSIVVRNMLDDWGTQLPMDLEIQRTGGPEGAKPVARFSEQELVQRTAQLVKADVNGLVDLMTRSFGHVAEPNTVSKPFTRGGGWGYSARGTFKLKDDEALLLTVDNPPDQYVSIQTVDPWLHSVEHVRANGSLNNHQAEPNKDGSFTYVISPRDAGVRNWLHTGGLHGGDFLIRWQDLPAAIAADAVREIKVVKLAELPALLPAMTRVTPAQRKAQSHQRAQEYARRYLAE